MGKRIRFHLINIFIIGILVSGCTKRQLFNDPNEITDGGSEQTGSGSGTEILKGNIHGTLLLKNSPYKIVGDITVDSLQELNIEAGVKLIFRQSTSLTVKGRLNCAGRADKPIIFTSEDQFWEGLQIINSTGRASILYSIFENIDVYTQIQDSVKMGAVEIKGSKGLVRNCIFRNNKSKNGGALYLEETQLEISNCIFMNNFAAIFGGAIISIGSSNHIINNTFTGNEAFNYAGGLLLMNPMGDEVQNNIFYKNRGRSGDPSITVKSNQIDSYIIKFNYTESAFSDPLFISDTDLRLKAGSPCINAGNPAPEYNDLDGSRNDQGAYGGPMGVW